MRGGGGGGGGGGGEDGVEAVHEIALSEGVPVSAVDALQLFVGGDVAEVEVLVEAREAAEGVGDEVEEDGHDEGHGVVPEGLFQGMGGAVAVDAGAHGDLGDAEGKGKYDIE